MIHQIGELEDKLLLTNADKLVVVNQNDANAMLAGNLMSNLCQTETFSNLQTTDKTIEGAINELYSLLSNLDFNKILPENIASIKRGLGWSSAVSAWVYYPDDTHYLILACNGPIEFSIWFDDCNRDTGLTPYRISTSTGVATVSSPIEGETTGLAVTGIEKGKLQDSTDTPRTQSEFSGRTFVQSEPPIYTADSRIFNLSENSHPLTRRFLSDGAVISFKEMFTQLKISDLYQVTSVPQGFDLDSITQGAVLFGKGTVSHVVMACGGSDSRLYVDGNGGLNSYTGAHYESNVLNHNNFTNDYRLITLYDSTGTTAYAGGGLSPNQVMFSTYDIEDLGGNIVYHANTTLEDFKSMFVLD